MNEKKKHSKVIFQFDVKKLKQYIIFWATTIILF